MVTSAGLQLRLQALAGPPPDRRGRARRARAPELPVLELWRGQGAAARGAPPRVLAPSNANAGGGGAGGLGGLGRKPLTVSSPRRAGAPALPLSPRKKNSGGPGMGGTGGLGGGGAGSGTAAAAAEPRGGRGGGAGSGGQGPYRTRKARLRATGGRSARWVDSGAASCGAPGPGPADSPRGSPREIAALAGGRGGLRVGTDEGPLSAAQALRSHRHVLSGHEQSEILDYRQVWFCGKPGVEKAGGGAEGEGANNGFDDENGDYRPFPHDHLAYRYEVLGVIGKGSFGQVLKCFDHKLRELKAVKIIRNKRRFYQQALVEVRILEHLRAADPARTKGNVRLCEHFLFRNHLCMAFELLSVNLYEFIKNNGFQGISLGLIRRFASQILGSLSFLQRQSIIHCDLKPENILLVQPSKSAVRVIDFGSSTFESERLYTYIQSRFYRAPEVILGLPYLYPIDMWSFGCILAELYTGYPLFPGENEADQLACIMEVLDVPPADLVEASPRRRLFFDRALQPRIVANSRGRKRKAGAKNLASVLRCENMPFLSFLQGLLCWEPSERLTPEEALQHEFIAESYYLGGRGPGRGRDEGGPEGHPNCRILPPIDLGLLGPKKLARA